MARQVPDIATYRDTCLYYKTIASAEQHSGYGACRPYV